MLTIAGKRQPAPDSTPASHKEVVRVVWGFFFFGGLGLFLVNEPKIGFLNPQAALFILRYS